MLKDKLLKIIEFVKTIKLKYLLIFLGLVLVIAIAWQPNAPSITPQRTDPNLNTPARDLNIITVIPNEAIVQGIDPFFKFYVTFNKTINLDSVVISISPEIPFGKYLKPDSPNTLIIYPKGQSWQSNAAYTVRISSGKSVDGRSILSEPYSIPFTFVPVTNMSGEAISPEILDEMLRQAEERRQSSQSQPQ